MPRALPVLAALALVGCADDGSGPRDARVIDAPPQLDGAVGVACLGADCAPDQVCCRETLVPPTPSYFCVPDEMSCGGDPIACDGPEDCASELCCEQVGGVRCTTEDSCFPGNRVCQTGADCPLGRCCESPSGVIRICCPP